MQKQNSRFLIWFFLFISQRNLAQLTLNPVFGDKAITEDTWFITKNGDSIQFETIRFYLSDVSLEYADNSIIRDTVKAHLIDVFDPNTLKIGMNTQNIKKLKTLRFNIGIDSLTNIAGALGGDLDPQKGMYWAWQSGYINMKIEGKSPQCKSRKHQFQYHIGGYLSPFYSLRHIEIPIEKSVNAQGGILKIDFSKFFDTIQIASQNSIMMPCKEAMFLADYSTQMFSILRDGN